MIHFIHMTLLYHTVVAIAMDMLAFAGLERNGKWASGWVASNCITIMDKVQKHLVNTISGKRSEWMEAMTSTVECLQRQVSDGAQQGEKRAQEMSLKLHTAHQRQMQEKESEVIEAKKTVRSVSLQAEDLTSQLGLAQVREFALKQDLAQWQEKAGVLEEESQTATQRHQEELAQLQQRLQATEVDKKALASKVQQLEQQLLEMEHLVTDLRRAEASRETSSRPQPPAPPVERQSYCQCDHVTVYMYMYCMW